MYQLKCSPIKGQTCGCLQFMVVTLKFLKHPETYFYVNVSLHFSGTNNQEYNCWVVWRPKDFDKKAVEYEGAHLPHTNNGRT